MRIFGINFQAKRERKYVLLTEYNDLLQFCNSLSEGVIDLNKKYEAMRQKVYRDGKAEMPAENPPATPPIMNLPPGYTPSETEIPILKKGGLI